MSSNSIITKVNCQKSHGDFYHQGTPILAQSIHLLLTETCHGFWSAQKKERDDIRPRAPKQGGSDAESKQLYGPNAVF
jgi:hypothetical protein